MRELTCIVCPIGCSLAVDEGPAGADNVPSLNVSGNRCPRGAAYAREELFAPKRVVTATCSINAAVPGRCAHRVPVKTSVPCPKEQIPALLADIYAVTVSLPIRAGDTLIANWKGEGIDIVATRSIA